MSNPMLGLFAILIILAAISVRQSTRALRAQERVEKALREIAERLDRAR
ncbi:MAG: hypothetical protein R3F20_08895 [Planctomycetota bacterium]